MKYSVFSMSLIISVCYVGWSQNKSTWGHNSRVRVRDELVMSIINDAYDCKFEKALIEANELIKTAPDDPEGYFYKGGVYRRMLEEGCIVSNDSTKHEIRSLIDRACQISELKVRAYPDSALERFYYAAALVDRAWYEGADRNWFSVMSDGIKARKMLERAVEIDSDFYDAYTGIGAFECYAAHIPWYLKPLSLVLGISGDEDKGIAFIRESDRAWKVL